MTDNTRNEAITGLAGLALAGIAAYAGFRAIDAERRLADPDAKPLKDHIADTARGDMSRLRDSVEDCLQKAGDRIQKAGETFKQMMDDIEARAKDLGEHAADTAAKAAEGVSDTVSKTTDDAPTHADRPPA